MAQNKLSDLNNHLFSQLERLNDETLTEEQMKLELQKAKAVSQVSQQIIQNARVTLDAAKMVADGQVDGQKLPEYIE